MEANSAVSQARTKFKQAFEHLQDELKKVRTGRAHPSMLDGLMVEVYGTEMPLNQTASISTPESQTLQITPFDPNNLSAIANAIRNNKSLGMNPMDDGKVVRVPVPPLTEERRLEYVKVLNGKVEDCQISLRNIRHEAMDTIDKSKKSKEISEDDAKRLQKQVEDDLSDIKKQIDEAAKTKEQDILTV